MISIGRCTTYPSVGISSSPHQEKNFQQFQNSNLYGVLHNLSGGVPKTGVSGRMEQGDMGWVFWRGVGEMVGCYF